MKKLKIFLVIIVVTAILAGVYMWVAGIKPPQMPPLPQNPFTERIEIEIDSLINLPDNKFCGNFYKEITYHIEDYYKSGRLGNDTIENEQWKELLTKNLYSAYTDKFIEQAYYVFKGSKWENSDLKFIRNEYQTLRKSKLLEKGSPVDMKFTEIQNIFNKYDEIVSFINSCNNFSYSALGLNDQFPISDVQVKILKAEKYLSNRLENQYVNNCLRLRDDLKEIPKTLFKSHVKYLDNKINHWSNQYSNYNSQSDYANNLYFPLKKEIDVLDVEIYYVPNFNSEYSRLLNKWSADNTKAFNYVYPKFNN
jgi:hypothetical protein